MTTTRTDRHHDDENLSPDARHVQLLNGWWDFQPTAHADLAVPLEPDAVPKIDWLESCYLVPGFFTDHAYPETWRQSRSGWTRTTFEVEGSRLNSQRACLNVKAAIPKAFIFINGRFVAAQEDMFIGDEYDVTSFLNQGTNELAVFLTEFRTFPHPTSGTLSLIDVPWGCCIANSQAGLWQDVRIEWRPPARVADVTIRTSTRENTFTVITLVKNEGDTLFEGKLSHAIKEAGRTVLPLSPVSLSLAAGQSREIVQAVPWTNYSPWYPESPHLYELCSQLDAWTTATPAGGESNAGSNEEASVRPADRIHTRFGFREVWIEGHRVMLNGRPQRWYGEWCHKAHSHWLRPEYVRQWYNQLKDLNMNYVRMHTFPHPDYFFDIADEMGIMLCEESALHGSGQAGWETPELWPRVDAHVRRIIRRDKNHPSLVMYSVENEMRWSLNIVPGAKDRLPELRKLYDELDPTRPAYHEGDSSLWNEDQQPVISRHYGAASHGMGWWDNRAPLHAGELGRWHFASPYTALQWAGDEVFADYRFLSESLARDAARIIELARANEVSCLFPWNTSGLDNFRSGESRTFTWDNPNGRYPKPLAHQPYESEYAWWSPGSGYRPGYAFEFLRQAFRPVAIVIRQERAQFFNDRLIPHTVYVVNDLPQPLAGMLTVQFAQGGLVLYAKTTPLSVDPGCTGTVDLAIDPAGLGEPAGPCVIRTVFEAPGGGDAVERDVVLSARTATAATNGGAVAVVGRSAVTDWLRSQGVTVIEVADLTALEPEATPIILIAENSILPGSTQNSEIHRFVAQGGRALLLEQEHTVFPELPLARMPVEMAFVRDPDHPVMRGITDADLRFFGDDPFGLPSSDSWVTVLPYVKPRDAALVRVLVDSSGGNFGSGGLTWAPVVEMPLGRGILLASQLRMADRMEELPLAGRFLANALAHLAAYRPDTPQVLHVDAELSGSVEALTSNLSPSPLVESVRAEEAAVHFVQGGAAPHSTTPAEWVDRLQNGATVVVWELTDTAVSYWEQVVARKLDLFSPEHAVYHLIAAEPRSPLLAGLSNEDTCWLENWTYTQADRKEHIVDKLLHVDGARVHLCNATRSGLDVLYGDENATELKRMPALSAYFDSTPPRCGNALVEVAVGQGRVLFCQVRWKPDLWQFRRFFGMLLWNLGAGGASDVLTGETTPTAGRQSPGHPATLRAARADESVLHQVLSLGKRRAES
ncbi:MAG: hypothetical protein HQ559_09510, partial [Lentisphaerae bacterium]|nr:hypothetical protein [Lentisphaerota bacterium]